VFVESQRRKKKSASGRKEKKENATKKERWGRKRLLRLQKGSSTERRGEALYYGESY